MDPNKALQTMVELSNKIMQAYDSDGVCESDWQITLAENALALNAWIQQGGTLSKQNRSSQKGACKCKS